MPAVDRITCLVRPRLGQPGLDRLARVFALHGDLFARDRVVCIEGDLTDADLGARLGSCKALAETDLVIHCAAETSFSPFKSAAIEAINVEGTRRILSWASELRRLESFVYVGTAAIADADQQGLVHEDDAPRLGARHLVRYTQSKGEAEALVARRLPADKVLIVRPSILLGDSRGLSPRSIDVHWAVAVMNRLRLLPVDPQRSLDIIPADYAARAIIALIGAARRHRVYHISAGPEGATSAGALAAPLAERWPELPPFRFVDPALRPLLVRWARGRLPLPPAVAPYLSHLEHWRAQFPDRRELSAIVSAASTYFEFMQLGQVYDNSRLRADLPPLATPPPAHDYLRPMLDYLGQIDLVASVEA
jgi:nucleoside-diphosphate-sugar epimerase